MLIDVNVVGYCRKCLNKQECSVAKWYSICKFGENIDPKVGLGGTVCWVGEREGGRPTHSVRTEICEIDASTLRLIDTNGRYGKYY